MNLNSNSFIKKEEEKRKKEKKKERKKERKERVQITVPVTNGLASSRSQAPWCNTLYAPGRSLETANTSEKQNSIIILQSD